eukprot:SAG31_NODE_2447_length_5678_cov_5.028141_1_plen_1458_part_10
MSADNGHFAVLVGEGTSIYQQIRGLVAQSVDSQSNGSDHPTNWTDASSSGGPEADGSTTDDSSSGYRHQHLYQISFQAAAGYGTDKLLRVLVDGIEQWHGLIHANRENFDSYSFTFAHDSIVVDPLLHGDRLEDSFDVVFQNASPSEQGSESAIFLDNIEVDEVNVGTAYIFGGQGCDSAMCSAMAFLSDLWWFNGRAFFFVGGSTRMNNAGSYIGSADNRSAANMWPGGRAGAAAWWSPNSYHGFIFGGRGCDSAGCSSYAYLNDLWMVDVVRASVVDTHVHVDFVGGSHRKNQPGMYTDVAAQQSGSTVWPGGRQNAAAWFDDTMGRAFIFSGQGFSSQGQSAHVMSDLWLFDEVVPRSFMWMGGGDGGTAAEFRGSGDWPSPRTQTASWFDTNRQKAYVFGGFDAGNVRLAELFSFGQDFFAPCDSLSPAAAINLTSNANTASCVINSTIRSCTIDSCIAGYIAIGNGTISCDFNYDRSLRLDFEAATTAVPGTAGFACLACQEVEVEITHCSASSEYSAQSTCYQAFDHSYRLITGEWSTRQEGGGWIHLHFPAPYHISKMKFMQRSSPFDWTTAVTLEFSVGNSSNNFRHSLQLLQSPDEQIYTFSAVTSTSVRVIVDSTANPWSNNGAMEISFWGCLDHCAGMDPTDAPGLPAKVDTTNCHLSIDSPSCELATCTSGCRSVGSPSFLRCVPNGTQPILTYVESPIDQLQCVACPRKCLSAPQSVVVGGGSLYAVAGELRDLQLQLRNGTGHPLLSDEDCIDTGFLAVTSDMPGCRTITGDLWNLLASINRVPVCDASIIMEAQRESAATWRIQYRASTIPGTYFLRVFAQSRIVSPAFQSEFLVSGNQLNLTIQPGNISLERSTFQLSFPSANASNLTSGDMVLVTILLQDEFGNSRPLVLPDSSNWSSRRLLQDAESSALNIWMDETSISNHLNGGFGVRCLFEPTANLSDYQVDPTYEASFHGAGNYTLYVQYADVDMSGSPRILTVLDAVPNRLRFIESDSDSGSESWNDISNSGTVTSDTLTLNSFCKVDTDECRLLPCFHGGTCVSEFFSFSCICSAGWAGDNCETDIDECESIPCQNAGLCVDSTVLYSNSLSQSSSWAETEVGVFRCLCSSGFEGTHCEVDVDECQSRPCLHGLCTESSNTTMDFIGVEAGQYMCDCFAGWSGANCEADVDECASLPCQNGGTCKDSLTSSNILIDAFVCNCTFGWYGESCQMNSLLYSFSLIVADVDECASRPCAHGSTCVDSRVTGMNISIGDYSCICMHGFFGSRCQFDVDCSTAPCYTESACHDVAAPGVGYVCDPCPPGFSGDGSSCVDIDDCASSPCGVGGNCTDMGSDDYTCDCEFGFLHTNGSCAEVFPCDDVESRGCDANASCSHIGPGRHTCTCNEGFSGNGSVCEDTDGCLDSVCFGGCHDVAAPGVGYVCDPCPPGFSGDGSSCVDIDDCASS